MASRQSHPLPAAPGGSQQYADSYSQSYAPNYQQGYQSYQQVPVQHDGLQQMPPAPPLHSAQQRSRPKSRALSFRSDKSAKSGGSNQRVDLHETAAEKESKRLHSKADPTLAINEAEPASVQANVKSSLASLRDMQHKDPYGNPIADPDKSNPTRSRWERPLDTIRAFEAAIDGGYNRKSMLRSDTESIANWNRRSTYYGSNPTRLPQDNYSGGRPMAGRADGSQYDMRQGGPPARDSYFDPQAGGGSYPPNPPNPPSHGLRYSRMASDPQLQTYGRPEQQGVYPIPNNHRSYETVASASGSGTSAEPVGYQTDPTSSDNSSIERMQSPPKRQPDPANDYGITFTQSAAYQPPAFSVGGNAPGAGRPPVAPTQYQNGGSYGYDSAPTVPSKDRSALTRKASRVPSNDLLQVRPGAGEKRKSWLARCFSKQA